MRAAGIWIWHVRFGHLGPLHFSMVAPRLRCSDYVSISQCHPMPSAIFMKFCKSYYPYSKVNIWSLELSMTLSFSVLMCWEKVEKPPTMHCCTRMDEHINYSKYRVIIFIKEIRSIYIQLSKSILLLISKVSLQLLVNKNMF